ncbi:tRNA lysidine(34) synthetase TilS [Flavobacterium sp.]|uniref:tRNA lysidine(34) synthetase TilS n=1 Tax=Flavobacterium sp. TaxID=239 RepID=UPI003527CAF6
MQNNFPFLCESKIFIAVSGGIDSMVLVDLLLQSQLKFTILHCNFQLRGEESDSETYFIRTFCKQKQIPYIIKFFETEKYAIANKLSIQLAARELRYSWFQEEIEKKGNGFLLTAHHADDNLETFIINLSRGTGIDGLTGIPEQNENIIRPLLPFSRAEIISYANENRLEWKEDSSNASDKYLRNKIRHQIVPVLKELHPTFLENFQKTQNFLLENQQFVNNHSEQLYEQIVEKHNNSIQIALNKLLILPNWKTYLFQWLKPYGFTNWDDIYRLVTISQTGKIIENNDYTILKNRDELIVYKVHNENQIFSISTTTSSLNFPLNITLKNVNTIGKSNRNSIFVDSDKLHFPLYLRKWEEGDYFYPNGMIGKKKLSKFFKDEKYSLYDKQNQWLLTANNEIVWVIGKRVDQRFLANENTQQILKIEVVNT